MKTLNYLLFLTFLIVFPLQSQNVFTSDIDNFWVAYDSVVKVQDVEKQKDIIKSLYIAKGTIGLKKFMVAREYDAEEWVKLINAFPKFWNSIRQNTLEVKNKIVEIEQSIIRFKELYPELKDAKMYFTIGGLRSGGTVAENMVLIGSEIACGIPSTDVSEFKDNWLRDVFKNQSLENLIYLNIHEYVHTQQKRGEGKTLLAQSIKEGSCDFIAEKVLNKKLNTSYINYGNQHLKELKEEFKKEMLSNNFNNWLYNGSNAKNVADLGYFIGYAICKSYYENAKDKKKAIKEIIRLKYSNNSSVEEFLEKSKFYSE
jgi:hypothetical protein